jgi:hypothetical protein
VGSYLGTNMNSTAVADADVLISAATSFTNLWCRVSATTTDVITFTLFVDGSASGTACRIPAGQTGAYSVANNYSISAGSVIAVQVANATSAASERAYWGLSTVAGPSSPNDFSVSATPTSQAVSQAGTTTYTLNTSLLAGSSENATLSVLSGCPANTTCSVTGANPISTSSGSSTLTVTTTSSTPIGTYILTVLAAATSFTHTTTVTLIVQYQGGTNAAGAFPTSLGTAPCPAANCNYGDAHAQLTPNTTTTNGNFIPPAITLTTFSVTLSQAPVGSTATLTVALMKNGAVALSCTITAPGGTTCTATGSVSFNGTSDTMNVSLVRSTGGVPTPTNPSATWTVRP